MGRTWNVQNDTEHRDLKMNLDWKEQKNMTIHYEKN